MTHEVDGLVGAAFDDLPEDRHFGLHESGLEPRPRLGLPVTPTVVYQGPTPRRGTQALGKVLPCLDRAEAIMQEYRYPCRCAGRAALHDPQPVLTEDLMPGRNQRVLVKKTSDWSRKGATGSGTSMPIGGSKPKNRPGEASGSKGGGNSGKTQSMWNFREPAAIPV